MVSPQGACHIGGHLQVNCLEGASGKPAAGKGDELPLAGPLNAAPGAGTEDLVKHTPKQNTAKSLTSKRHIANIWGNEDKALSFLKNSEGTFLTLRM